MRILGITIPENKRLEIGLTSLYGVGRSRAQKILDSVRVEHGARPKDVSTDVENQIRKEIGAFKLEGDLKREIAGNVKRLKDIKSYRGTRHAKRLPAHGQRTKTNSRTVRGNVRKTMGSGRKKAEKT
jgi:small subunit ribosomal protein S13